MEVVEVSGVGGEEVGTNPSFLQKSWMPSWMLTMQRYVIIKYRVLILILTCTHVIKDVSYFVSVSDGHQLKKKAPTLIFFIWIIRCDGWTSHILNYMDCFIV